VGIPNSDNPNIKEPAIIIEMKKGKRNDSKLLEEIITLAGSNPFTQHIRHFLFYPDFPVDIRHNAKIFREKLAIWAQKELRK